MVLGATRSYSKIEPYIRVYTVGILVTSAGGLYFRPLIVWFLEVRVLIGEHLFIVKVMSNCVKNHTNKS